LLNVTFCVKNLKKFGPKHLSLLERDIVVNV